MFLGIVLSYHGEPSLTLAVTACRILLIPACLIPNLIPACTLHPNCLSLPSPYKPCSSLSPFTLCSFFLHPILYLAFCPTLQPIVYPFTPHPTIHFHPSLSTVCPFHPFTFISSNALPIPPHIYFILPFLPTTCYILS